MNLSTGEADIMDFKHQHVERHRYQAGDGGWWLILHVNSPGLWAPQSGVVSAVSMRVLPSKSSISIGGLDKVDYPHPRQCGWAPSSPLRA